MNFNESTPRADVTIQGTVFAVPQPYVEGHALTSNEASAMNQLLSENIRNNFAGKIKAEADKPEGERKEYTQADLDEYVASYEFGVRRSGGSSEARLPPEQREARKIAREKVVEALKAKNISIKSVDSEKMEEMVSTLAQRPEIIKIAQRRVKEVSSMSLEALGLEGIEESQAAA